MAIIVNPEVKNQECSNTITYCYLFEPLRVNIAETNTLATKLYIEIERYDIVNKTILVPFLPGVNTLQRYVEIDLLPNKSVTIDFSEVMIQLHNAGVFKVGVTGDIETSGEKMIVSQYIYSFKITTDTTLTPVIVKKLPILGGRSFKQFTPTVTKNQFLTEFEYYGLNPIQIATRWSNFIFYKTLLKDPVTQTNLQPTISQIVSAPGDTTSGGVLYWKSRFGGWMFWGFDLEKRVTTGMQQGEVAVQMFESTKEINGDPYIPVDYTTIESSESIELKALGLSSLELLAVTGISSGAVVYYAADNSGKLELMRVTSSSAPWTNLATGGDFTVNLTSISKTSQKTM